MSLLADLEVARRTTLDFSPIERTHLHRAVLEDDLAIVKGRERIVEADLAAAAETGGETIRIVHDLGDMIVFESSAGWRGHRWAWREGDRIAREVLVVDGMARLASGGGNPASEALLAGLASPDHRPLGELRPGRGQLGTPAEPPLPPGFPSAAVSAARHLHRFWNARALDVVCSEWLGPEGCADGRAFALTLLARMPDLVIMIERGLISEGRVALLWRLHGHLVGLPTRVRAFGSSVMRLDGNVVVAEQMMIDGLAMASHAHRPPIDYL